MFCSLQLHQHHLYLQYRLMHIYSLQFNGETVLPIGVCLISLKVTIFSLGAIIHYSVIIKWFNIQVATAHHPVIQKELDEILAQWTIEPLTVGADIYSNVFVVSKHTGSLQSIFNLKQFNHYIHIPTFKMPTVSKVCHLFSKMIMLFIFTSKIFICKFLLLSIISFSWYVH